MCILVRIYVELNIQGTLVIALLLSGLLTPMALWMGGVYRRNTRRNNLKGTNCRQYLGSRGSDVLDGNDGNDEIAGNKGDGHCK
jgi:hypothetical protein